VADILTGAWREGVCQPYEALELLSEADAYTVQQIVATQLGWFDDDGICAWKLGGNPGGLISAARIPLAAIHASG
jgi:hypothetical protein